jgi:hypothetical protein
MVGLIVDTHYPSVRTYGPYVRVVRIDFKYLKHATSDRGWNEFW